MLSDELGSLQALAKEMPRMPFWEMFQSTEYFISCARVKSDALEGERIEICTLAALRQAFCLGMRKQLGADALAPHLRRNPKSQDIEPAPIYLAIDSAHKRAARISCRYADARDVSVASTFGVRLKQSVENCSRNVGARLGLYGDAQSVRNWLGGGHAA
jgi:hypothetical protein